MKKENLQIGSKLYAYEINRGWGVNARKIVFTITRETKTMWVLSIGNNEIQKVRKENLMVHGNGSSVVTEPVPHLDKQVKDINDYKKLRSMISDLEKDVCKSSGKLSDENKKILDFLEGGK